MMRLGIQFDLVKGRCSSCAAHSLLLFFGLILADSVTLPNRKARVKCSFFTKYSHCERRADDAHALECFGKHNKLGFRKCVWQPGKHASEKTYTLIVHQGKRSCQAFVNTTQFHETVVVFENSDMTVEVLVSDESGNCNRSVFKASPKSLLRCDPPYHVALGRKSGNLRVNVSWNDSTAVLRYSVRYKPVTGLTWIQPSLQSQNSQMFTVENLNPSLFYAVQIRCVTNEKCSQCPWSQTYTVPPELTTKPLIVKHRDSDIAGERGSRAVSLHWEFPSEEPYDTYYVTVMKASGEDPREQIIATCPQITLVLSFSSYHLTISAVNNASVSPAASWTVPRREFPPSAEEQLNVTVHSNTSFTLNWRDDLIQNYVCYSAEWSKEGHNPVLVPFYQDAHNFRTLSNLPEPLEPYTRYSIMLHTRPEKDTCNIKFINRSESSYGSTHFYFMEGAPLVAPNISNCNVTLKSVVLHWTSIPEEDARGFLLGYVIHYTEYLTRGSASENHVTVGPNFDSYELADLKAGTAYQVQVSGFTVAGAGVRGSACVFRTNNQGTFDPKLSGVIVLFAVVAALLILGSLIIKRVKVVFWTNIPNPEKSFALQKMEGLCEMELVASFSTLQVEEWDTSSLHVSAREEAPLPASLSTLMLPLLRSGSEDHEGSDEDGTCSCDHEDTEDEAGDQGPTDTFSNVQISTLAFSGDYTTMEMFRQAMPQKTTGTPE